MTACEFDYPVYFYIWSAALAIVIVWMAWHIGHVHK